MDLWQAVKTPKSKSDMSVLFVSVPTSRQVQPKGLVTEIEIGEFDQLLCANVGGGVAIYQSIIDFLKTGSCEAT